MSLNKMAWNEQNGTKQNRKYQHTLFQAVRLSGAGGGRQVHLHICSLGYQVKCTSYSVVFDEGLFCPRGH